MHHWIAYREIETWVYGAAFAKRTLMIYGKYRLLLPSISESMDLRQRIYSY